MIYRKRTLDVCKHTYSFMNHSSQFSPKAMNIFTCDENVILV